MGARGASIAVRASAFNECDKERRVEIVSQQGLARFAPPDSSTAQARRVTLLQIRSRLCWLARLQSSPPIPCATPSWSPEALPAVRVIIKHATGRVLAVGASCSQQLRDCEIDRRRCSRMAICGKAMANMSWVVGCSGVRVLRWWKRE
jgi:hypothetical protein